MSRSNYSRIFVTIHEPGLNVDELAKVLAESLDHQPNHLAVDSEKLAEELKDILTTTQ